MPIQLITLVGRNISMALVAEYGLDSPPRRLLLLALSLKDRMQQRKMDKFHIQKVIRYYEYLRNRPLEVDFSNYDMGGVSYEIHENAETLEEYGLIERKGDYYLLTDEGERAANEIKRAFSKDDLQKFAFSKFQLNDLSLDEAMYFMYMMVPETRQHSAHFTSLEKKNAVLVRSLYVKGRINSVTASKWLGISEKEFESWLSK